MPNPLPFQFLIHSDWSKYPEYRWFCMAARKGDGWVAGAPRLVGPTDEFVDSLFDLQGPVLAGFDFPIGLPATYARLAGIIDFRSALPQFGKGEWSQFYEIAKTPDEISIKRPFYPYGSKDVKRSHLLDGLGMPNPADLLRVCERRTPTRPAASSLFWTLGAKQVGRAAITGWQEILVPALARGAKLWPFDGNLRDLGRSSSVVLAETYPAESYAHVGAKFATGMSKRNCEHRVSALMEIDSWTTDNGVSFTLELANEIKDGFGDKANGEDRFDAFTGLLGMILVADGKRREMPAKRLDPKCLEGWILGQAES